MSGRLHPAPVVALATLLSLAAAACASGTPSRDPTPQPTPSSPFRFSADDVWLNLHHFLYVLGRAEAGMPDASRRAVADAPADQARGLETLTPAERATWQAAVTTYAEGPSQLDPIFDGPLIEAGGILADLGNAETLAGSGLDPELRRTLEVAAPIYRKAWWPDHRAANHRWHVALEPLIEQHGAAVLEFILRAYGFAWPADGYPVHVTAYTNWAGAFSTSGNLLLVSSLDRGNTGLSALETVVHEAMHQWDDAVWEPLLEEAREQGRYILRDLTHAMIFMTAGEAVRSAVPDHVPYAEANGLWDRGIGAFRPALDAAWLPYLRGRGTRAEAFAELVRRTGETR